MDGYKTIVACLDGSEQQDIVLERAIGVAERNKAKLIVAHAIDSTALESAGAYPVDLIEGLKEAFNNSIAELVDKAKECGVDIEVKVVAGRIRETLRDILDDVNPDLIMCGSRGLSGIKYALLGSVSTFLLRYSDCDLMVIK